MPTRPLFALSLLLTSCGSDIQITKSAICNGVQEPSEYAVDAGFDRDEDGYFDGSNPDCVNTYPADRLDCDDTNADVHPGQDEVSCNDLDDDCDEATVDTEDADGDRFASCEECDDSDPSINPAQDEVPCNGLDDDCDETTIDGEDQDADGFTICDDCDDVRADVNPGAAETVCNGLDDDCNPGTSDGDDLDADGFTDCDDCDDHDDAINPGHDEECKDEIDNDCDGEVDEDCAADYTDTWSLNKTVSYSCAFGLVSLSFYGVNIVDSYPDIWVSPVPSAAQPGLMTGSFTASDAFSVSNTLSGSCNEIYSMDGTFTDENTFTATFTANFTGSCFDCKKTSWTVTGTR